MNSLITTFQRTALTPPLSRGMRNSALKKLRAFNKARPPTPKAIPARNNPKRDATVYGIPRVKQNVINRDTWEDETHPLWKFFNNKEALNPPDRIRDKASRSWSAPELRTKSFEDLHHLWYILLRERNALYSEAAEWKRCEVRLSFGFIQAKIYRCRKGMARIKYVLNERRRAAIEAAAIIQAEAKGIKPEDRTPLFNRSSRPRPKKAKKGLAPGTPPRRKQAKESFTESVVEPALPAPQTQVTP